MRQATRRAPTVRLYLLLIALAVFLPVWGMAGHVAGRMAEAERDRLSAQAAEAARELAFGLEREVLGLRGELAALGRSPALRNQDFAAFHEAARTLPMTYRARIWLTDVQGHIVVDSGRAFIDPHKPGIVLPVLRDAPRSTGISSRHSLTADEPLRLDITEELWPQGPGHPSLFLTASLDPMPLWRPRIQRLTVPSEWIVTIIDENARLLARSPPLPGSVGRELTATSPIRRVLRTDSNQGWLLSQTARSEPVYTAWRRVESTPWTVTVSLPTETLDGALYRVLTPVVLVGGSVLAMFTLALALWVDRRVATPLGRLGEIAHAFGRGGPLPAFPPTGLREIDEAAAALTKAAAERDDLEAERIALSARLHTVLESTTDSVLVLDREGVLLYLNGRARALAASTGEAIGRRLPESFPGWDEGPFSAAFEVARQDGTAQSVTAFHPALARWISADIFPSAEGLTLFFRDVSDERAAQAALRESEARLKAVMDNVPVGVLLAEAPSGRILLGNRRLEEILRSPVELLGGIGEYRAKLEAYHADGRRMDGPEFPLARALLTGLPATAEHHYRRGDGSMVWLRVAGTPIRDAQGRIVGAVAAITDIDASRRAAEALRESELRFRTLAEAIPQIVWSTLPDGRIDYVNPRLQDFTGLAPGIAVQSLDRLVHPEDQQRAERAWRRALRGGKPFSAELRLRRAEGGWRWCVARALPARAADGTIRRWIGAVTDVSELAEAREALARQVAAQTASRKAAVQAAADLAASESRFRRFAEASPDVMWMSDISGQNLEFLSPAFERIWGVSQERMEREPGLWVEMIHPADRDRVQAAATQARITGMQDIEYRITRPDGGMRWIRDVGFPILDAQGRMTRRGGLSRDVTDAKAAEARQALLLGELNHRVKNTLATVHSLALQTARNVVGAPDAIPRFLQDFQARLLTLSRGHDLLTARTWRGATLEETARAVLAPWQGEAAGEPGEFRFRIGGPTVWLAPKQALGLALALHELATNALKHGALTHQDGRIVVRWGGEADGMVQLMWREGNGPPVRAPSRKGFGTRMLERGLPAELGPGSSVKLNYESDGFVAAIRFRPVNGPVVEEEPA
ncbi:PAS domain S-box protein [Pseudoroseomonas globiformis]|uniref:histidine kinase n=1 Tax=Teichococcus globiformis TaxID=2307229 RepID=A0ABV7G629_9PROT